MRRLICCATALLATGFSILPASAQNDSALLERARRIHESVITIDTHDDIPGNYATPEMNPCTGTRMQVDVPKMREGGLDVAFLIVYVGQTLRTPENYERAQQQAMQKFEAIHRLTKELCPDQIGLALTADDVERIHESGRLVAAIGIENGYVIGRDISLLEKYHTLGARYMTLAHNGHNDIADSWQPSERSGDEGFEHNGLSAFGEQVVAEMNRLGIMVDVSHISKAAALHAARISRAPIIASHSSARALTSIERNMDDEMMRALAKTGGVMQTVAFAGYVKEQPPERQQAMQALRQELGIAGGRGGMQNLDDATRARYQKGMAEIESRWPSAAVTDFVDHIDYAVKLIGVDHVGISSDFDGGGGVTGWDSAAETFNITLELVRRGYSEDDIRKLWGGNLLRVWRENERVAREISGT
ncbi:MAG TPA: dipeptidase [Longimicrobiales bacterium]|nr:dipeptidase [Longimicrobiales bacterium]